MRRRPKGSLSIHFLVPLVAPPPSRAELPTGFRSRRTGSLFNLPHVEPAREPIDRFALAVALLHLVVGLTGAG